MNISLRTIWAPEKSGNFSLIPTCSISEGFFFFGCGARY